MGQGKLCISRPDMKLHKSLLPVIQKNQRFVRNAAVVAARNLSFVREILERYNGTYFYDFDFSAFVFLERLQEEQAQENRYADEVRALKKSIQTWNIFHRHMHLSLWSSVNELCRQNLLLMYSYPSWSSYTNFGDAPNAPLPKSPDRPARLYITTKRYRETVYNLTWGNRILPSAERLRMEFGRQMLVYQLVKKEYEGLQTLKFLFPGYSRIRDLMRMSAEEPSTRIQAGRPALSKLTEFPKLTELSALPALRPVSGGEKDLGIRPTAGQSNDLYWMEFYRNLIQITNLHDSLNDISLDASIFESVENGLQVLISQENRLKEIYNSYKMDSQTEVFESFVEEKSALLHAIVNYEKTYPEAENYWLETLIHRVRHFNEEEWRQFCRIRSEASQITERLSQLRTDIRHFYNRTELYDQAADIIRLADGNKFDDVMPNGNELDNYLDGFKELVYRRSIVAEVFNDYQSQVQSGRLIHLAEQKQFFFNRLKEHKQWHWQSFPMQGPLMTKLCSLLNIEQKDLEADARLCDIYSTEKEAAGYDHGQWVTFLHHIAHSFTDVTEYSSILEKNRLSVIEVIRNMKMMFRDLSKLKIPEDEVSRWSNAEKQALKIVKSWVSGHQSISSELMILKSCEGKLCRMLRNTTGFDGNLQPEDNFISPLRALFIQMALQTIELTDKFSMQINEMAEIQNRRRVHQMQDIVYSGVSRRLWEFFDVNGEGQWTRVYISYTRQVRRLQALAEIYAQFKACRDTLSVMETNEERTLFISLVRDYKRLHTDVGDSHFYKEQRLLLTHPFIVQQMPEIADLNKLSEYIQLTDLFDESQLYLVERMNTQQWTALKRAIQNMADAGPDLPYTVADMPGTGLSIKNYIFSAVDDEAMYRDAEMIHWMTSRQKMLSYEEQMLESTVSELLKEEQHNRESEKQKADSGMSIVYETLAALFQNYALESNRYMGERRQLYKYIRLIENRVQLSQAVETFQKIIEKQELLDETELRSRFLNLIIESFSAKSAKNYINAVENIVNMDHSQWKTFLTELTKEAYTGIYESWSALHTQAKLLIQNENDLEVSVRSFVYDNLIRNVIKANNLTTQQYDIAAGLYNAHDSEHTDISETTLRLSAMNEQLKQKSYITDILLSYKEAKDQKILHTIQEQKNFLIQKLLTYVENIISGAVDPKRTSDSIKYAESYEIESFADDTKYESSEFLVHMLFEHLQKGQISKNEIGVLNEMNNQMWESFSQALIEMSSSVYKKELQAGMDEVMKIRRKLETERLFAGLLKNYSRIVEQYEIKDIRIQKEYLSKLFSEARINLTGIKDIGDCKASNRPVDAAKMLTEIEILIHRQQILSRKIERLSRRTEPMESGVSRRPAVLESEVNRLVPMTMAQNGSPEPEKTMPNKTAPNHTVQNKTMLNQTAPNRMAPNQRQTMEDMMLNRRPMPEEIVTPLSTKMIEKQEELKIEAAKEVYKLSKDIMNTLSISTWWRPKSLKNQFINSSDGVRFMAPDTFADSHLTVLTALPKAVRHFTLLLAADNQKESDYLWMNQDAGNKENTEYIVYGIEDAVFHLQENLSAVWNDYAVSHIQFAAVNMGNTSDYVQDLAVNIPRHISDRIQEYIQTSVIGNVQDNIQTNVPGGVQDNIQTKVLSGVQDNIQTNVLSGVQQNIQTNVSNSTRENVQMEILRNAQKSVPSREIEALIRLAPSLSQADEQLKDQGARLHAMKETLNRQETQVDDLLAQQKALKQRLEAQEENMRQQPEDADLYGRMLWKLQNDLRLERMRRGID